ncbi:MAG: hypothetical protein ABSA83_14110 [Verrucomicrobiota bacterium]|jgi:hypothetical protein
MSFTRLSGDTHARRAPRLGTECQPYHPKLIKLLLPENPERAKRVDLG